MNFIIEHFIPAEEGIIIIIKLKIVQRLEKKLEFNEEVDDWILKED